MQIFRRLIFISLIGLLGWLFVINSYEIDIVPNKNRVFQNEKIIEIENSSSLPELKKIAKSEVYRTNRINELKSEKSTKELYIIFIITLSLFLFLTQKPAKTHNS